MEKKVYGKFKKKKQNKRKKSKSTTDPGMK